MHQYDVSHPPCDDVRLLDFVGYKTFARVTLTCLRGIALVYTAVEAVALHKQVCTDLFKVDKSHVAVVGINPGSCVESKTFISNARLCDLRAEDICYVIFQMNIWFKK